MSYHQLHVPHGGAIIIIVLVLRLVLLLNAIVDYGWKLQPSHILTSIFICTQSDVGEGGQLSTGDGSSMLSTGMTWICINGALGF